MSTAKPVSEDALTSSVFLPDLLLIGADDDDDEQVPQLRVPDSKAHEQCLAPQYSGHDA